MVNKVTLIGNLGKDPEVRRLENGAVVAKFSLATNESYKDKDGNRVKQTEWHNIVVWRQLAEIAEKFLKKGMLVYIEGKLTHREYVDKDNQKKFFTEVVANNFQMLERREGGGDGYFPADEPGSTSSAPQENSSQPEPVETGGGDDAAGDLPF